MKYQRLLTVIWVLSVSVCTGCNETIVHSEPAPGPYTSTENDGVLHAFYKDLRFREFIFALPDNSLDFVDDQETAVLLRDPKLKEHSLVLVTATLKGNDVPYSFVTTFTSADGKDVVREWSVEMNNTERLGRGLFLVPYGANHGRTVRVAGKSPGSPKETDPVSDASAGQSAS